MKSASFEKAPNDHLSLSRIRITQGSVCKANYGSLGTMHRKLSDRLRLSLLEVEPKYRFAVVVSLNGSEIIMHASKTSALERYFR
jgi:hypothetical protein